MEAVFLHNGYMERKIRSMMERELRYRIDGLNDVSEVDRALRLYKEEEFLRIGCRDLAGLADVQEVMGELSDLAAASVQTATVSIGIVLLPFTAGRQLKETEWGLL